MLLVDHVQAAYGGLERWQALSAFTAHLSISGAALPPHQAPRSDPTLREFVVEGDTRKPVVCIYAGFVDRYCVYTPDRVEFRNRKGQVLEVLENPLASFRLQPRTAFSPLQRGMILGAMLWEAIVGPFMLCQPPARCTERKGDQTSRPGKHILDIATSRSVDPLAPARSQYFDADYLLEHSEYDLGSIGLGQVIDNASAPFKFGGIVVPTLRRLSKASDRPGRASALIDLEIFDVRFST